MLTKTEITVDFCDCHQGRPSTAFRSNKPTVRIFIDRFEIKHSLQRDFAIRTQIGTEMNETSFSSTTASDRILGLKPLMMKLEWKGEPRTN